MAPSHSNVVVPLHRQQIQEHDHFAGYDQDGLPERLTHLRQLEAESIHIIREVVAELDNPVMLYSIGKDSSVMLHLAMKAFHPGRPPFPLLHVDTTWKFREMIAFRNQEVKRLGVELLVHVNEDGVREGVGPITHGPQMHTDIMKTQALKQALDKYGFDAAFGGARRDEEKSRAQRTDILVPHPRPPLGSKDAATRALAAL